MNCEKVRHKLMRLNDWQFNPYAQSMRINIREQHNSLMGSGNLPDNFKSQAMFRFSSLLLGTGNAAVVIQLFQKWFTDSTSIILHDETAVCLHEKNGDCYFTACRVVYDTITYQVDQHPLEQ